MENLPAWRSSTKKFLTFAMIGHLARGVLLVNTKLVLPSQPNPETNFSAPKPFISVEVNLENLTSYFDLKFPPHNLTATSSGNIESCGTTRL